MQKPTRSDNIGHDDIGVVAQLVTQIKVSYVKFLSA
jgi:hypothetical protein